MGKLLNVTFVIVAVLIAFGSYHSDKLDGIIRVGAGFGAKTACSGVFMANRTLEQIFEGEFSFPPLHKLFDIKLDYENQCATAIAPFGIFHRTACLHSNRLGCSLIVEEQKANSKSAFKSIPHGELNSVIPEPNFSLDDLEWPMGNKLNATLQSQAREGIDMDRLHQLVEEHFNASELQARALIIVRNGEIIFEKYGTGYNADSRLLGWSMSKSVLASLINLRIKEGKLNLHDPVQFPWFDSRDDRSKLTIANYLQMSDGSAWDEFYYPWSAVPQMLYNQPSTAHFAAAKSLRIHNGKHTECFHYSSATTNLLSYLLRLSFEKEYSDPKQALHEYLKYPFEKFFYPVGMHSAAFEIDPVGTFIGSSYCWATARDWARFGLLYLPSHPHFADLFTPDWHEFVSNASSLSRGFYGGHFWRGGNYTFEEGEHEECLLCDSLYPDRLDPPKDKWRKLPDGTFFAHGFEEQMTLVAPKHNVVLVRLGCTNELLNANWDRGGFYRDIMKLFELK